MLLRFFGFCAFLLAASGAAATVGSVTVTGTQRQVELETRPGSTLDTATVRGDVRRLWEAGWVSDVRVESRDGPLGAEVVFHIVEKPVRYLREVRVTGAPAARNKIPPGTRIDQWIAHQTAANIERSLEGQGYRDAEARATLIPADSMRSDLHLSVTPGPKYVVNRVGFTGDLRLDPAELRAALRATRPRTILPKLWRARPVLTEEAVASDVSRLRGLYAARGYFDASVSAGEPEFKSSVATINYHIDAGPRYAVESLSTEGLAATAPLARADGELPHDELCKCLATARRQAEREGRPDFEASLLAAKRGPGHVDLTLAASAGPVYRVGRIEFSGHHSYGDGTLRRTMRLDEGDLLDQGKLYAGLRRLESLGLFEPVTDETVTLVRNPESRTADIRIALRERPKGRWALSGPAGPFSLGGPLHASIGSRLPGWGRGLLEASTYYLTLNVVGFSRALSALPGGDGRAIIPYVALSRPFLAGQEWTSGFAISPQIGWKATAANYAIGQAHQRLRRTRLLSGRAAERPLAAPVKEGDRTISLLLCEAPKPRFRWLRTGASFALDWFLGARLF